MKLSKLVAVLVVVIGLGIGERCGAQSLSMETVVGDTVSVAMDNCPCGISEYGSVVSWVFDTAKADAAGISRCYPRFCYAPRVAGLVSIYYGMRWRCDNHLGPRYVDNSISLSCLGHDSASFFVTPTLAVTVPCNYLIDSQYFLGVYHPTVWNLSSQSISISNWSLTLKKKSISLQMYDSINGSVLSSLSLAPKTKLSGLVIHLVIPDSIAAGGVTDGVLSCTVQRMIGDSTLSIPLNLVLSAPRTDGISSDKPSVKLALASMQSGSDTVHFQFQGILDSLSLDSLPLPLHCELLRLARHDASVRVWQDGSPGGDYSSTLKFRYVTLAPYLRFNRVDYSMPILSKVEYRSADSVWEQLPFGTGSRTYKFAFGEDGSEYVYGSGAYRFSNDSGNVDTIIDPIYEVVNLNFQSGGVLTSIIHLNGGAPDPNFRNKIDYSTDHGSNWQFVSVGPLKLGWSTTLPNIGYGFEPLTAIRQNDSDYLAIGTGFIGRDSFVQCLFRSSDYGQHWKAIDSLRDPRLESDRGQHMLLTVEPNGNILIAQQTRVDTFGRGSSALAGIGELNKRFPDGTLLFFTDSIVELQQHHTRSTFVAAPQFGSATKQLLAFAISDSEFFSLDSDRAIYRTTDKGKTWLSYTGGLDGPVTSMGVSLTGHAYAATSKYLYRSKELFPSAFSNPTSSVAMTPPVKVVDAVFRAYPNPASSVLTVEGSESLRRVELYDILGQRLPVEFKTTNSGLRGVGELHDLTEGIYVVRIEHAGGIQSILVRITKVRM